MNLRDSQQAAELHRMLYEWQAAANALRKGEITWEAYDQWRYHFPDGDTPPAAGESFVPGLDG